MASKKSSMKGPKSSSGPSLAGTLIKILAVGVAGGAALIGGAKKLGEEIEKQQTLEYIRMEQEREAQKEAARAAAAADEDNIEETAKEVFAEPEAKEEAEAPEEKDQTAEEAEAEEKAETEEEAEDKGEAGEEKK